MSALAFLDRGPRFAWATLVLALLAVGLLFALLPKTSSDASPSAGLPAGSPAAQGTDPLPEVPPPHSTPRPLVWTRGGGGAPPHRGRAPSGTPAPPPPPPPRPPPAPPPPLPPRGPPPPVGGGRPPPPPPPAPPPPPGGGPPQNPPPPPGGGRPPPPPPPVSTPASPDRSASRPTSATRSRAP